MSTLSVVRGHRLRHGLRGPTLGGRLYKAFNTAWGNFESKYSDDPDFEPGEPFEDLLEAIDGIASTSQVYEDETPAGCWGYRSFYIESPLGVKPASGSSVLRVSPGGSGGHTGAQ